MSTDVEAVKAKLNIVDVITKFIPLKKRGRHYVACCPFHHEKTPSFTVSPELQIFKCFGCGKSGDIFTFVQEFDRISFHESLEELAKLAGIKLTVNPAVSRQEILKKVLYQINDTVANFYHFILLNHPLGKPALDYVLNRGITEETIKLFKIGYSPESSLTTLNYLAKKNFTPADLIATGTFGQSQYGSRQLYDRFQGRLVFPLTDYRGQVLGFSGRILPPEFRSPSKTAFDAAKYINSPETEIYHKSHTLFGINLAKDAIRIQNSVIVVEGEFDLISPYQQGIHNIVAIKGTAFTSDQLNLLRRYTDSLILGLDSDFAGNNAARRSIEMADSMEFDIKVLTLGDEYKDPDEACQKDPDFFKSQLENPIPVWDFLIEATVKASGVDTVKGKKAVLSTVLPSIVRISNHVIRTDYLRRLSQVIGSDYDSVLAESRNYSSITSSSPNPKSQLLPTTPVSAPTAPLASEKAEEYLLTLILGARNPVALANQINSKYNFTVPRFKIILDLLSVQTEFDPSLFQPILPAEIQAIFASLYLAATLDTLDSEARSLQVAKTFNQLKITEIKDKINRLSQQIARAENSVSGSVPELEREYTQLLLELSKLQSKKS